MSTNNAPDEPTVLEETEGHNDITIIDHAPKRTHVFGDLVHAALAIIGASIIVLIALYLKGITTGVESDAHSAARAVDWLVDVPASLLQQLAILVIVVSVVIQLLLQKEWLQTALCVGALILGFAGAWCVSLIISASDNMMLINALLSASTKQGMSLLPDFYAAIASFLTVAGPRRTRSAVKWGWNIIYGTAIILIIGSWNGVAGVVVSMCIGRLIGLVIRFAAGTQNTGAWGMQVVSALRSIGLQPTELKRVEVSNDDSGVLRNTLDDDLVENSRIYSMTDNHEKTYTVSVLDNQRHIAGYLNQLWQMIRLSGVAIRHDRSAISAQHHHFSMLLGLHNLGLATMRAYGVADSGESSILVFEHGVKAKEISENNITQDDMRAMFAYLDTAHKRGFTHRRITIDTLAQKEDGTQFIAGWQNGDYASSSSNIALDKVQLLALSATLFGVEQTVSMAKTAWGEETLINLIPFVQKVAVPTSTRALDGWNKKLLEQLRSAMSALAPEEVSESLEQVTLSRFSARSFIGIVLLVVAIAVILTQLKPEEMIHAIKEANLGFAILCIVFGFLAWVGSAVTLGGFMDKDKRSYFGLLCSQMAAGFTAVSMPAGIGPAFVNLQFLRKSGYRNTVATAIMSAVWVIQAVVTVLLLVGIGIFTGQYTLSGMVPTNTLIFAIAGVLLIVSIAMAIPAVRHKVTQTVIPLVKSYARSLMEILTQPTELLIGIVGALLLNLATGFGFWAALLAFGYHMNPIETTFIFLLANSLGSAVPTPGGLGAVEAALSLSFTAVGVPSAIALSATLVYRVVFYWLRIPVGALAMKWLDRHNLV